MARPNQNANPINEHLVHSPKQVLQMEICSGDKIIRFKHRLQ